MIRQALHGYDQGHRLLAASPGLAQAERELLDRLSDLPGYLPLNYRFGRYLTGYPCGQGYALAGTWPDPDAPRGGAVFTHTLLVSPELLDKYSFFSFVALLRRPTRGDPGPYTVVLSNPTAGPPGPQVAPELLAALFGPVERPILRVGVGEAEAAIAGVWDRLWPEARARFSFCTSAFAPISLPDKPFDLLYLPAEARGAFHRQLAGRKEGGDVPPWVARVQRVDTVSAWIRRCRELGAPVPAMDQLWVLARLDELEEPATHRLAAARARADLMARIWPAAEVAPQCWTAAMIDLLRAQHQALLTPRPFWELSDLLDRPQLASVAGSLPQLGEVIRTEVALRFPSAAVPDALLTRAGALGLRGAVEGGVLDAVRAAGDWTEAVGRVLDELPQFASAVLALFPPAERPGLCGARVGTGLVLEAARSLRDPLLLVASRVARGEPCVDEAMSLAAPEERVQVLAAVPRAEALVWALAHGDSLSQTELVRLGWDVAEVAPACATAPAGVHVFLALAGLVDRKRRTELYRAHPLLAERVLAHDPASVLALEAAEVVPGERQLVIVDPARAPAHLVSGLAEPLARRLVSATHEVSLRRWLEEPRMVRELRWLPAWRLRGLAGSLQGAALPNLLANAGEAALQAEELLVLALQTVGRDALEEASLGLLLLPDWPLRVAAEVVGAVRRTNAACGPALLERAFPPVYGAALREDPAVRQASWWNELWWDRAKKLRHWLTDTWIRERWPAAPLREILRSDQELMRKVDRRLLGVGARHLTELGGL